LGRVSAVAAAAGPRLHGLGWSRSRRALRVAIATGRGDEVVEVDVPVGDVAASLAAAGGDPLIPRYLLFAGRDDRPAGGVRDLVGTYREEDAAKAAFRRERRRQVDDGAWAELVAVDAMGRCRPVCWFGREWRLRRDVAAADVRPLPPPAARRRWFTSPRSPARP
jgi:hypothetical protein